MKARFHGGPLDGATHPGDDWADAGSPYDAVLTCDGEIIGRWRWTVALSRRVYDPMQPPYALYLYDRGKSSPVVVQYTHVGGEGGE